VTPDGQTVVIGGLMQDSKTSTDSKVPILGDIPGIGLLFHHKIQSDAKTELIILLTPYVVRTPSDLAHMSDDERGRSELAPKAFPQKEYNEYLEPGQASPPPVYPAGLGHVNRLAGCRAFACPKGVSPYAHRPRPQHFHHLWPADALPPVYRRRRQQGTP
jgi:hypothetical protein